jgi:proline iminopeptidase
MRLTQPSATEGHHIVSGAQLFFREIGAGSPFVVLHGGPDFNHHYLLPEMDRLAGTFRLIYYDQRGRGRSSGDVVPEDVTIESEVDDLDRLRVKLGLDTMALLGHSWGCIVALEYAARHPERVDRLIVMNSAPASYADRQRFLEHRQATESDALSRMRAIASTREFVDGDVGTEAEYYRIHYGRAFARPEHIEPVVARLRVHFTASDIVKARAIEHRLYEQTWLRPDYDVPARLRRFASPTLVIHGAEDFVPVACSRTIAGALPNARLVVLEDCGHFSYLEQPEAVLRSITGLIS